LRLGLLGFSVCPPKRTQRFDTEYVSVIKWQGGDAPTQFSSLEGANFKLEKIMAIGTFQ
jgi:hypothetical protein